MNQEFVEHQQYVFDTLWNKSIPSEEKIKEIEDGIQPNVTEIIRDFHQMQKLGVKLTTSAREEILVLLSTGKAFYRQDKLGALVLGEQMANQGVKIRLLTPSSDWVKQRAQGFFFKYIELRYIPEELQTQLSIFIYDRKSSLIVETKDDSTDSAYEAAGFVTYSPSNCIILSINI